MVAWTQEPDTGSVLSVRFAGPALPDRSGVSAARSQQVGHSYTLRLR